MKGVLVVLATAFSAVSPPVSAEILVLTHATVESADSSTGQVNILIQGGIIKSVGHAPPPTGARVIDASGQWVTAGLIGGFTRLGLREVDLVEQSNDAAAKRSEFSAAIDITPGINPASVNIPVSRAGGITAAVVSPAPGRTVFEGQGVIITSAARSDVVLRHRAFQFVELGEAGAALAGGSRPAAFAQFFAGLKRAREFAHEGPRSSVRDEEPGRALSRADIEALVPVVEGRQPLVVHVERASDIENVLRARHDFPALHLIIVGAAEGWQVADQLRTERVPVIVTVFQNLPERFEMLGADQSNAGLLVRAGVLVALGSLDDADSRMIRLLPQAAGNLVGLARIHGATGLTHAEAMATITSAPAEIFGLQDMGSLATGKRADIVVWDGDPLEVASRPSVVLVDGEVQSLATRQTELRDRYRPTQLP